MYKKSQVIKNPIYKKSSCIGFVLGQTRENNEQTRKNKDKQRKTQENKEKTRNNMENTRKNKEKHVILSNS